MLRFLTAARSRAPLPIFPLNAVLYPAGLLPLRIFELRYVDMARECLREDRPFGVCLIREGQEVGAPAVPEEIGCLARIGACEVEELGILKVRAEGLERFRIVSREATRQGLVVAEVEPLGEERPAPDAPGLAECAEFLRKVIGAIGEERFSAPLEFGDATWVGFRLAEILPLRNEVKQKLLELTDGAMRIGVLHRFLRQQQLIS